MERITQEHQVFDVEHVLDFIKLITVRIERLKEGKFYLMPLFDHNDYSPICPATLNRFESVKKPEKWVGKWNPDPGA